MCHRSHQTSLACGEGCIHCETKRLTKETAHKDIQGSGDKGYQWDCANCYTLAKNSPADIRNSLHTIINALSAKFEVVNKIQLPKLNGELVHIKHMSENIAKQNTEILRKLSEAEKRNSRKTSFTIATVNGYRKRNLNFPTLGEFLVFFITFVIKWTDIINVFDTLDLAICYPAQS